MSENFKIKELEQMAKFIVPEADRNKTEEYMEFLMNDFEKLNDVVTDGVKPLIHGIELENVFREDKIIKKIDRETLLKNAPESEKGFFKVPMTID